MIAGTDVYNLFLLTSTRNFALLKRRESSTQLDSRLPLEHSATRIDQLSTEFEKFIQFLIFNPNFLLNN